MDSRERIFDTLHDLESWIEQMGVRMAVSESIAADNVRRIEHLGALMDINAEKAIEEQDRQGRRDDPLIAYLDARRKSS